MRRFLTNASEINVRNVSLCHVMSSHDTYYATLLTFISIRILRVQGLSGSDLGKRL